VKTMYTAVVREGRTNLSACNVAANERIDRSYERPALGNG
jgi:hypothetical protein